MGTYQYDENFMRLTAQNRQSATIVVDEVLRHIEVSSVVDFGCAEGAWLAEWRERGVQDVVGLDGHYVDIDRLVVPRSSFQSVDLSTEIDLGRRFSIVQSLEVAEHIEASRAETFVGNLARHGDVILFSAAPPGQGGENHINEQPYDYWREMFARHGYDAYDGLRTTIAAHGGRVQPWYRYNIFLYATTSGADALSESLRAGRVPNGEPLSDVSPPSYKLRKQLIKRLPRALVEAGAKIKSKANA